MTIIILLFITIPTWKDQSKLYAFVDIIVNRKK